MKFSDKLRKFPEDVKSLSVMHKVTGNQRIKGRKK